MKYFCQNIHPCVWSSGSRQDEILSQMRHGLVQTNYRMSVKITWTMFPHTILSGPEQDNNHQPGFVKKETSLNKSSQLTG